MNGSILCYSSNVGNLFELNFSIMQYILLNIIPLNVFSMCRNKGNAKRLAQSSH